MKLILVRHSKTVVDKEIPSPFWILSKEGLRFAQKLAKDKIWKEVGIIYTSDQLKAIETGLQIAKHNRIPLTIEPDFTEITSFTRGFLPDYEASVERFYKVKETRLLDGETKEEALQRFSNALDRVISNHEDENLAVVSHCNILTVFIRQFIKKSYLDIHHSMPMPSYAVIDWDNKKLLKEFTDG